MTTGMAKCMQNKHFYQLHNQIVVHINNIHLFEIYVQNRIVKLWGCISRILLVWETVGKNREVKPSIADWLGKMSLSITTLSN